MTDQVVDWTVCWQLREGRGELMSFNWSVSCQLSLDPHLTLSDGVSLLHISERGCVIERCLSLRVGLCVREGARELQRNIRYVCVCVLGGIIKSSVILAHLRVWWWFLLWSIERNPTRVKNTRFTLSSHSGLLINLHFPTRCWLVWDAVGCHTKKNVSNTHYITHIYIVT